MAKRSITLSTNHIRSHKHKEERKTVLLHKLYERTYIETLIENLVHDRHVEIKHKQTNRVHPITKKKRKEVKMGSLDPGRHKTILYLFLCVSNSLCVRLG